MWRNFQNGKAPDVCKASLPLCDGFVSACVPGNRHLRSKNPTPPPIHRNKIRRTWEVTKTEIQIEPKLKYRLNHLQSVTIDQVLLYEKKKSVLGCKQWAGKEFPYPGINCAPRSFGCCRAVSVALAGSGPYPRCPLGGAHDQSSVVKTHLSSSSPSRTWRPRLFTLVLHSQTTGLYFYSTFKS